jgi:hypothetical protein
LGREGEDRKSFQGKIHILESTAMYRKINRFGVGCGANNATPEKTKC